MTVGFRGYQPKEPTLPQNTPILGIKKVFFISIKGYMTGYYLSYITNNNYFS
jgi:hypothetical protein